jgi:integrase
MPLSAAAECGKRTDRATGADRAQKTRTMSWAERDAVLAAAAQDRRQGALFAVLLKAGLRPGEGFALTPEDVDFARGVLRVERSATDDGRVKATKTDEAREVDLTPDLVLTLRRHLTWLRAEGLRTGTGEPAWLFPRPDGTLPNKGYAAAIFRRILKRAKVGHFRVYDCRHTYASLLLSSNAALVYVSKQLGHASPATTLRHYARWIPSGGRRWVDMLDRPGRPMEPLDGTTTGEASGSV